MATKDQLPPETRIYGFVYGKCRKGTIKPIPEGEERETFMPGHVAVLWDCNKEMLISKHPRDLHVLNE